MTLALMGREKLRELVRISRHFGADPEFLVAGGGNTSYKTATHLYVKASGAALSEITAEGFVCMRRESLARMWERSYPEDPLGREAAVLADMLAAREKGEEGKRPSVETPLHDFLPQSYVVHTHPPLVNGLTCARRGRQEARRLFGSRVLWVPTVNPGYVLAGTVRREIERYRRREGHDPDILLFQNHGLCVGGESLQEIAEKTELVLRTLREQLSESPDLSPADFDRSRAAELAPCLRMLLLEEGSGSILVFHSSAAVRVFLDTPSSFSGLSTSFTPDQIVYCQHEPLFVAHQASAEQQRKRLQEGVEEYRRRNGFPPKIVAVQKLGAFAWGTSRKNADSALALFLDAVKVAVYSRSFGGPLPMPPEQVEFIKGWEVEAYRRRVSLGTGSGGRVAERIAIVTGAAQGFGLGLAEALAREGANVVLADLNAAGAEQQARRLCRSYGAGKARAETVDVRQEASMAQLITSTVLQYGGLDLFVSNAGVLKAGSLEELDPKSFALVTEVNYTGYYLGCRHASVPMKIQHRYRPGYWMDIVQINSKSGLTGSNRNFAYAGSKFGGIGLTESFALELVGDNIKVNSICPGNYFDGPLWSDPRKGLFIQYLRAGKVTGARSVEDVRRAYEAKVPMGRGCTVQDVARALLYLVEQQYETGQALPVTGGQVMLK
jgi:NAD(P)-dependent dehydrogenase (short-subunit alcohol dehydrogenase family)/rhamnose utilization protein RhaD (predicted bifunctional aldolase and dehydrogenase)